VSKAKNGQVPLVVTTEHKGVFFGYGEPSAEKTIRIEKARMCVYWSTDVRGVLGLASVGPSKSCRVGPPVPAITLQGVTSIMECSPEAAEKWEGQPWQS
jgi:hypothetical protein